MQGSRYRLLAGIVVATMVAVVPAARAATTITVSSTTDTYSKADKVCSLRDAVEAVNTGAAFGACPAGGTATTIVLPQGTYTLMAPTGSDDNSTGDLNIDAPVSIQGAGAASTTISAAHHGRVMRIAAPATVSISGVTITAGKAPSGAAGNPNGGVGGNGGAIDNAGTLVLQSVTVSSSTAGAGGAGGTSNTASASGGTGGGGGGIYSSGPLDLKSGVTLTGNVAGAGGTAGSGLGGPDGGGTGGGGGAVLATGPLTVTAATFTNNAAGAGGAFNSSGSGTFGGDGGSGGAIDATAGATVDNATFSSNHAGAGASGAAGGSGGALAAPTSGAQLSITASTFTTNKAGAGGNSLLTQVSSVSSGGAGGAISGAATTSVTQSTFEGNTSGVGGVLSFNPGEPIDAAASGSGGALSATGPLSLSGDSFTNNSTATGAPAITPGASGNGGAIESTGQLNVATTTFDANHTGQGGPQAVSGDGGASGGGGAIDARGITTIDESSFTTNSTGSGGSASGGATGSSGSGGAIATTGRLTLTASTLSGNAVGTGGSTGKGAALWTSGAGPWSLTNDTVAGNGSASVSSGSALYFTGTGNAAVEAVTDASNLATGVAQAGSSKVTLADTLLSNDGQSNCAGTITDGTHNLSTDNSCPNTFVQGAPKLASALADNGGSTATLALGSGSAAIDTGAPSAGPACPTTDQRGMPRPQGSACDIGAFEAASPSIAISSPANGARYVQGQALKASYDCTEGGLAKFISSCTGPVTSGASIPTTATGSHSFTVTATDVTGNQVSRTVTYTIAPKLYELKIVFHGRGHGTVVAGTKHCTRSCSEMLRAGARVRISARAARGSTFAGFSGACRGKRPCTITMTANRTLTVSFKRRPTKHHRRRRRKR
jgi:CSLREA domain-containing protein